jgi:hypothetical protein
MLKTGAHNQFSISLGSTLALASEAVTTIKPLVHLHVIDLHIAHVRPVVDATMENLSRVAPVD